MSRPVVLFIVVLSQFLCTSVWFAGNAVIGELISDLKLPDRALGQITSAVQLGFVAGTLSFAVLTIADRFSPIRVFLISSLIAAGFNLGILAAGDNLMHVLTLRFFTGFFLAGVYPVGMKIAADHYDNQLGKALGYLVGALVVGTALPHFIKYLSLEVSWTMVFKVTTILAVAGGMLVGLLVPNGPHRRRSKGFDGGAVFRVFGRREFRAATFGYFGHMWELYAFWAFVPVALGYYAGNEATGVNIPLLSFLVIAGGGVACAVSGYVSQRIGVKKTATMALACSGVCCLLSPLSFFLPLPMFIAYYIFWGLMVVADSPMFSTMVAQNAPVDAKGTALTIVNCIGFSITIVSIQLLSFMAERVSISFIFIVLAVGPLLGLAGMYYKGKHSTL